MKYALHYKPLTGKCYLQADEVIFNKVDDILKYVIDNSETEQRLIFDADSWYYENEEEWTAAFKNLIALKEKNYNIVVRTVEDDEHLIDYSEANIPYFSIRWCNNWDWLHHLIDLGVSDIYIVEQMGFELDKVRKVCGDKIQLRTYPDVCQVRPYNGSIYGFFIIPNEVHLYDGFIDVCEFFKEDKEDVLYDIYTKGKWLGNLKSVISDLKEDLYSTYLFPTFGIYRRSCGKRCLKGEKCNLCQRAIDLSKELQKEGIMLQVKKETEDATVD